MIQWELVIVNGKQIRKLFEDFGSEISADCQVFRAGFNGAATQTAEMTGLNRNTVNRFFMGMRQADRRI